MRSADIEGNFSTGLYSRYFVVIDRLWLVLVTLCDFNQPGGTPLPSPQRWWFTGLVHGEAFLPKGYAAPVFRMDKAQECRASEEAWNGELFPAMEQLGVRRDATSDEWIVQEANVDRVLQTLIDRAAMGYFRASPSK